MDSMQAGVLLVICVTVGLTLIELGIDGRENKLRRNSVYLYTLQTCSKCYIRLLSCSIDKDMHGLRHFNGRVLIDLYAERAIQARCRNLSVSDE